MNGTARTLSLGPLLWSSLLFTATPALTTTGVGAQLRGARPAPARPAPPPVRSFPARPAPSRGNPATVHARPIVRAPAPRPRPRGTPENAIVPLTPLDGRRAPGPSPGGDGSAAPPSPVTLTLDSITADPEEKARARKAAEEFFRLHVPAKVAAPAMRKVTKLRWHKTLARATSEAMKANKPVLWIQALGDLKGFT